MNLSRGILKLFGWRVTGSIDDSIRKFVVIAVPHTSAWDFPLGVFARSAIGRDIKYIGKKSLFKPPVGWLMKKLGGYPVDRSVRGNMVSQVVDIFNSKDDFAIAIAPEGTRERVDKFKTGFYHIAKGAGVPIIFAAFDYENREVRFHPEPFYPTDDQEADMQFIRDHFKGVQGKVPGKGVE